MGIPSEPDKPLSAEAVLRDGEVLAVAGDEPVVVQCLAGQLWITEENDARDYVLPECASFRSWGRGRIVVSGMAGSSRVRIVRLEPAQAQRVRPGVSVGLECAERLRRAAQREAASAVGRWIMHGARAIMRLLRREEVVASRRNRFHGGCA